MATRIDKHQSRGRHTEIWATGFVLAGFMISLGSLVSYKMGGIEWTSMHFDLGGFFFGLVVMLLLAIVEELIFRRLVLRMLTGYVGIGGAVVASSILFTFVHLSNAGIDTLSATNVFLGGVAFGLMYVATGSLGFVIAFHFAWNFLQGPVLGFPVSGLMFESIFALEYGEPSIYNGGKFGFEGSIVCSILLLILILALLALLYTGRLSVRRKFLSRSNSRKQVSS